MPLVICLKNALKLLKPMFWPVVKDAPFESAIAPETDFAKAQLGLLEITC